MKNILFIVFAWSASAVMYSADKKAEPLVDSSKQLLAAVENKEPVEVIQKLIDSKAGTEAAYYLTDDDEVDLEHYCWRPIHFASFDNNLPVVQTLLNARATVDANKHGRFSPVTYTTNAAVAQLLFEHGASPDNMQGVGIGWNNIPLLTDRNATEVAFRFGLFFDVNLKATQECQNEWYSGLVATYQKEPPPEVLALLQNISAHVTVTPLAQLVMDYFCKHNLDALAQLNKAQVEKKGLTFKGTTQKEYNAQTHKKNVEQAKTIPKKLRENKTKQS